MYPGSEWKARFVTAGWTRTRRQSLQSQLEREAPRSARDSDGGGREDVRVGPQKVIATPITGRKGRSASGVRESPRQGWKA